MAFDKYKIKIWAVSLIFFKSFLSFANSDFTLEELENLRKINAITQEEYEIFLRELTDGIANESDLYTLKIGELLNRNYVVINENGKNYFNLQSFFETIQFKNYGIEGKEVKIYLGTELEEIILDLDGNRVFNSGKEIDFLEDYPKFILKDGIVFIEQDVFKNLFLNYCEIDNQKMEINANLSFTPPLAIEQLIEINKNNLEEKAAKNQLIFNGKRDWFNLGYLDLDIDYVFNKGEGETKYSRDWETDIGYQGGLLFGEFSFDYDLRENELTGLKLEYDEIVQEHNFEIIRDSLKSDGLWTIRLYKDRGYYEEDGRVRIVESVPLGSRVELLYMGIPIEIQDEVNGRVEFENDAIRTDREYQLKIYYPDGRISIKDVVTTIDYNRQKLGEIEYDINFEEVRGHSGFDSNLGFYYGVSNNFTIGLGFDRELTRSIDDSKRYMHSVNGELIFGNTFNGTSYILKIDGEQTLDNFLNSENKRVSDRNQFGYLTEIAKNKWKITYDEINYGSYYLEKKERELELSYDIFRNVTLDYSYIKTYNYDGDSKRENLLTTTVDYSFKNFLIDTVADFNLEDGDRNSYEVNLYWNSFENWTTRLENHWENNGRDYEVALELYNNNFGGVVDLSAEFRYSERDKESVGLKVNVILDGWLTFDADVDRAGNRSFAMGIDRIIDLKNPRERLHSIDVSRADIVAFVDENNNNIYDEGEITVDGVEVELGNRKVITDKEGRAKMFGLSNGIEYELNPKVKKPSYSFGDNEIKIMSRFSSDVTVHIPIKPLMNLSGYVDIDEELNIKLEAREEFYSNVIVQILNEKGEEIEITSPDNTGYFDISGLYPENYMIKVYYIGEDFEIPNLSEELKLVYEGDNFDYNIMLDISRDKIGIIKE